MFRLWVKKWKDTRLERDLVITDQSPDTRTHKIQNALEEACRQMDLGKPIWLEANIREFKRHARARFGQDSFVEEIDFDYLEIHVLEEDG